MSSSIATRSSALLASLDALGCPLTHDLSEARFNDLLFQPGDWREKLIRWLLMLVDAQLVQSLEAHTQLAPPRLAHMAAGLGVCPSHRADIFSGSARRLDQLAFFEKLLRLADFNAGLRQPIRSAEAVANELKASVDLLTWHLTAEPLLQCLAAGPASFLSPDLGLLLRDRVEKRKAEGQPLDWSMAAWQQQMKTEAAEKEETAKESAVGEFSSELTAGRQEEELERLAASCDRFLKADERSFRHVVQKRSGEKHEQETGGMEAVEGLEARLASLASLRSGVRRAELAMMEFEASTLVRPPVSDGLAREVVQLIDNGDADER